MTISTVSVRWKFIALFLVLTITVTGCANVRRGTSWPALDTVVLDDQIHVIVVYNEKIELLNPATGQISPIVDANGDPVRDDQNNPRIWKIEGGDGEQFYTAPLILPDPDDAQETWVFPTYNNSIIAVDSETGDVIPPMTAAPELDSGVIADIVVGDGLLYVPYRSGSQDDDTGERKGGLAALDMETYETQWRLETQEGVWAAPLLNDGVLYVTSIDHLLYAVDAETGEAVWDAPVDLQGAIASTPLFYEDHLYVGSYSHSMYKISTDGKIVAEYQGENWIWSTPVIEDGVLYYSDLSGNVYALDESDFSLVWTAHPAERGIRPAPIVTDEFVIVASRDGTVYWLDRDSGSIINAREVEDRPELLSDVLLIEEDEDAGIPQSMVVVGSTDNGALVAAFSLDTSLPLWVYSR